MSQEVRAYLDEDVYDDVCEESDRTGKSKSKVVNENVRAGLSDAEDWFMRSFAQSLFVIGFVIAYYQSFAAGVGTSFLGLGLMLYFQMNAHVKQRDASYWEAFKRTLGVH